MIKFNKINAFNIMIYSALIKIYLKVIKYKMLKIIIEYLLMKPFDVFIFDIVKGYLNINEGRFFNIIKKIGVKIYCGHTKMTYKVIDYQKAYDVINNLRKATLDEKIDFFEKYIKRVRG